MQRRLVQIIALVLLPLFTGCETVQPVRYQIQVSGLSAGIHNDGKTYYLASALKNTPESDLQFREYARYLERALEKQGLRRMQSIDEADQIVFLAYGIGDPQTVQYSYAVPTWGQTGVSGAHTSGAAFSFGGMTKYSASTDFTPSYGVTGYVPVTGIVTYYFRFIRIDCFDLAAYRKDKKEHQLWRTDITSDGSSGDLRRVLPYMIAAAKPHLGSDTGKQILIQLEEGDAVKILDGKGTSCGEGEKLRAGRCVPKH